MHGKALGAGQPTSWCVNPIYLFIETMLLKKRYYIGRKPIRNETYQLVLAIGSRSANCDQLQLTLFIQSFGSDFEGIGVSFCKILRGHVLDISMWRSLSMIKKCKEASLFSCLDLIVDM